MTKSPPIVSLAEGWAIVPVEPTMLQLNAAADATGAGSGMSWNGLSPQRLFEQAWSAMLAASPAHTPAPDTRLPEGMEGYAPCPTCHQYSHSLGGDHLAEAFNHFQSMFSHRGDGIPTQYTFDEKTRDAAQVLMTAARSTPHPAVEVTEKRAREAFRMGWIARGDYGTDRDDYAELIADEMSAAIAALRPDTTSDKGDR